jgi:hypothetical protein
MFSLQEFGELRYLWLKYSLELKRCHTYVKKDGKMVPTGIDSERMKRYYKRIVAVDRALKCLIAEYPAAVFYAFVCPTGSLQHFDALTRHDSA